MRLYMVRHGQSYVNLKDWDGKDIDRELTELGEKQARAVGPWLREHVPDVDLIYSSTMQRARQTAAAIALAYGREVRHDDRLREIGANRRDHSAWPHGDQPTRYREFWREELPFEAVMHDAPEGETVMHFRFRVGQLLEELRVQQRDKTVVAVCHGGVMEATLQHIFNVGPYRSGGAELWTKNTGIMHIEAIYDRPVRWRLHGHNWHDHLWPDKLS